MLRHKYIDRICCIVLALTLLVSGLFVGAAATGSITPDTTIGYENRLFDQSRVHTIDIVMDSQSLEGGWEAFLDTATSEEYTACHLVIDGESFRNVAIRGKGNTSLSSVASYGNDRYSFKIEFDHYQTGSTYHGLDKLSLNNLIYDNTYMKDYFAYTLMNQMGVAAPLCSFVQVSVNGEYWGLYLAVEGVEDAFLQRNYGKDYGELYKPDSMSFGGGRGNGGDFDMGALMENFGVSGDSGEAGGFTMPDMSSFTLPEGFDPSQMRGGFGGASGESTAAATPAATATAEPTATPAADAGSSGTSAGDPAAAPSGMPAGGEMPDGFDPTLEMGSSGESVGTSAATDAPATDTSPADMPATGDKPSGFDRSQMTHGGAEQSGRSERTGRADIGGGGGFGGGFGMGSSDVKLQYADDDPSSYANIFDNAKTDITEADQTRLIASLKALNEGDVSVVDTDAVIRYMAVHNFLCNDDSYTGAIVHNYYLYEENGVLSMIPWDYNLAYGTQSMGSGGSNVTSIVNQDISVLVTNGSGDRPMADWITASDEYTAQYHAIYGEFVATVFESGWFESEIDRVVAMISPYVESDPTAFCTYEEFLTGAETLKQFCLRRAQSVRNQLDGSGTTVDASDLSLSDMGTMGGTGNRGGMGGNDFAERMRSFAGNSEAGAENTPPAMPAEGGSTAEPATTGGGFDFSSSAGSSESEGTPSATPAAGGMPSGDIPRGNEDASVSASPAQPAFTGGFDMRGMSGEAAASSPVPWLIACVLILGAALILVKIYPSRR